MTNDSLYILDWWRLLLDMRRWIGWWPSTGGPLPFQTNHWEKNTSAIQVETLSSKGPVVWCRCFITNSPTKKKTIKHCELFDCLASFRMERKKKKKEKSAIRNAVKGVECCFVSWVVPTWKAEKQKASRNAIYFICCFLCLLLSPSFQVLLIVWLLKEKENSIYFQLKINSRLLGLKTCLNSCVHTPCALSHDYVL